MKFFIDTANLDQIREANELGVLDGVTTNPSLMAKEGIRGIYFLFGLLTMIFHSVRRVGFHLYMAVSTLHLTSIRNLSEYWQLLLKHTSRCRSIFGFHILLSDTAVESCVTFKPRKAPIQLIQFSRFNNQKFCRYTFLYLFRFNAIISTTYH